MASKSKPALPNPLYETLKWAVQLVIPAFGALYFTLSQIWGFPAGEQVLGTIVAVETFLGVILGLSSYQYNRSGARFDGTMKIVPKQHGDVYQLELDEDPEEMTKKDNINFKVDRQ